MNQEIKQKWLDALRSGEYTQGKRMLRQDNNAFCCLGVLCDLHAKETGHMWDDFSKHLIGNERIKYSYCHDAVRLPDEVMDWAGLDSTCGELQREIPMESGTDCNCLTGLNDDGFTFVQIADVIEEQF